MCSVQQLLRDCCPSTTSGKATSTVADEVIDWPRVYREAVQAKRAGTGEIEQLSEISRTPRNVFSSTARHRDKEKIYSRNAIVSECKYTTKQPEQHEEQHGKQKRRCVKRKVYRLRLKIYDRDWPPILDAHEAHPNQGVGIQLECQRDPISGMPLSHITFVFLDLFCHMAKYSSPYLMSSDMTIYNKAMAPQNVMLVEAFISTLFPKFGFCVSGSMFEEITIPPWIKRLQANTADTDVHGAGFSQHVEVVVQGDCDLMVIDPQLSISFNSYEAIQDKTSNCIRMFIDTAYCRPGYLRLKQIDDSCGQLVETIYDRKTFLNNLLGERRQEGLFSVFSDMAKQHVSGSKDSYFIRHEGELHGPAFKMNVYINTRDSPTSTRYLEVEFDCVCAAACPAWPPVAEEWRQRNRGPCGWPPKELVAAICSAGCHIVCASHEWSDSKDAEFRFSFSYAEMLLATSLPVEVRNGYVAFKTLVKYIIGTMKDEFSLIAEIKTYHLKNVLFWMCEKVPPQRWATSRDAWSQCFLLLLDRFLESLKREHLPGYFVRAYNLYEAIPSPYLQKLATRVISLRENLLHETVIVLQRFVLYSTISMADILSPICIHSRNAEDTVLNELACLQNLIIALDLGQSTSGNGESCRLWRKSTAMDIFVKWCKMNIESGTLFSCVECLSAEMSLFDVVFLDIEYNFQLPETTLSEFIARENYSPVLNCLGRCYQLAILRAVGESHEAECYRRRGDAVFRRLLDNGRSAMSILCYASFLFSVGRHAETVAHLRECIDAEEQNSSSNIDVFNHIWPETMDEPVRRQITAISELTFESTEVPLAVYSRYLLAKCFRVLGMCEEALEKLGHELSCVVDNLKLSTLATYLVGEVFSWTMRERVHISQLTGRQQLIRQCYGDVRKDRCKFRCPHALITSQFLMSALNSWTKMADNEDVNCFGNNIRSLFHFIDAAPFSGNFLVKVVFYFMNEHWACPSFSYFHADEDVRKTVEHWRKALHHIAETVITLIARRRHASAATKIYYAQYLLNTRPPDAETIQLLEEIIETEKHHPTSVVVWPKELRMSVDGSVRTELDFAASVRGMDDFLVIPSLVYACYLLATLYLARGEMIHFQNVMCEFEMACQQLGDISSISFSLLGYSYQLAGLHLQAMGAFSRAVEVDPDHRLTRENVDASVAAMASLLDLRSHFRRRHVPSDFKLQREYSRVMQEFKGVMQPNLDYLPTYVSSFIRELLDVFENGRSYEDCLLCRMSD